jgi:hypothetical protein
MGTVHLLDISMDVPQGVTVTIPSHKATRSKDLWRLIAQKQLMRLNQGPGAPEPPPAPPMTEADKLREDNAMLHEQNRLLKLTFEQQGGKLDAILGLLASGAIQAASAQAAVGTAASTATVTPVSNGLVEIETPQYIPAEIKPKGVESHVEMQAAVSEGSGVEGAGAALRKLRQARSK